MAVAGGVQPVSAAVPAARARGTLLKAKLLKSFSRDQVDFQFRLAGFDKLTPVRYGMKAYQVTFRSVDPKGKPETQSGIVAAPDVTSGNRPLAQYFHGTSTRRVDAPSRWKSTDGNAAALAMASAGFLFCAPDYHGLGSSKGLHCFEQADPLAASGVDMLRAAKTLFGRQGRNWNRQLFLAGYSEGGYATLAAHRAIQMANSAEFTVTASAPGGGPYDLSSTTLKALLNEPGPSASAYLASTLLAYDRRYSLFRAPADAFQEPYAAGVKRLFNGKRTLAEIVSALPANPRDLLQPVLVEGLLSEQGNAVNARLRENDVYDWKPNAPIRFFHAGGDPEVPFANAVVARDRMQALGADVALVNVGDDLGHAAAAVPSLLGAFAWIESLATGL